MSSLNQDIKTKFLHLHVLEKIIVLNTSLFFFRNNPEFIGD